MCGRFALQASVKELAQAIEVASVRIMEERARFNIAPQQAVVAARAGDYGRELVELRWGLVPAWAKESDIGSRLINARSETVTEKPSCRDAFKRRRCLIPSSGFYEWARTEGRKQPYYFRMKSDAPFFFAGLWERWEGAGGKALETCTILTTQANDLLAPVHDRMPVILNPDAYELWLDPAVRESNDLTALLRPYPAAQMTSHPVSLNVNIALFNRMRLLVRTTCGSGWCCLRKTFHPLPQVVADRSDPGGWSHPSAYRCKPTNDSAELIAPLVNSA